jgi:hypothetical protein
MRVNVYAEEMTDRVEIITKHTHDGAFTGLRFYLELPISIPGPGGTSLSHRGPFIHRPGDDDSAAVTFWGKRDLRTLLRKALAELDRHYGGGAKQVYGYAESPITGETLTSKETYPKDYPQDPKQR